MDEDVLFTFMLGVFIGGLLGINMYRAYFFRELAVSMKEKMEKQNVAIPQQEGDITGRVSDDSTFSKS